MTKIVIVSGIQIINNPRVVKEATALAEAGFEVTVIGAVYDSASAPKIQSLLKGVSWRHIPVVDLSSGKIADRAKFFVARIRWKFWQLAKQIFGLEALGLLGYFPKQLYRLTLRERADLYIVHLEQALWVGQKLIQNGYKVATDFEDWYSEDCLPADRELRPLKLLRRYENFLLHHSSYCTTTSRALAEALVTSSHCRAPSVVYNSFPAKERETIDGLQKDRKDLTIPSIIWFSQTVGPGRGLEDLFAALSQIDAPFELHIRGTARLGICDSLLAMFPCEKHSRVFFHDQVPQHELLSRLCEHDIGYCGESSTPRNKDLTISNKTMEYLRAGLAIIASDTQGQVEVAEKLPGSMYVFKQGKSASLVDVLTRLLTDRVALESAKRASYSGFPKKFDWPFSQTVITDLVDGAILHPPLGFK